MSNEQFQEPYEGGTPSKMNPPDVVTVGKWLGVIVICTVVGSICALIIGATLSVIAKNF